MEHILKLSEEYRDLNGGDVIQVLNEPPTAIEFSRLVHISRPVVIKGFEPTALQKWNKRYLAQQMSDRKISVAVTPNGRADAVTRGPDEKLYFVEPHVEQMTMECLLNKVGRGNIDSAESEILYLQSQNGNLYSSSSSRSEFEPLLQDVPHDIPWVTEALGTIYLNIHGSLFIWPPGQGPDAVNIWCGDERSVTSIHSDPYENIYTVIRGQKHFFLLPPTDSWCLKGAYLKASLNRLHIEGASERNYPHAQYERTSPEAFTIVPKPDSQVRWSSIGEPDLPHALPSEIVPIKITLNAGESLYLPFGWWHYIKQTGFTIALNWWYDAEMRGMSWVVLNLLRNVARIRDGNGADEESNS